MSTSLTSIRRFNEAEIDPCFSKIGAPSLIIRCDFYPRLSTNSSPICPFASGENPDLALHRITLTKQHQSRFNKLKNVRNLLRDGEVPMFTMPKKLQEIRASEATPERPR
ncbi:hypothetical protein FANTH_8061 [Fusarium anthophilum]|uniref:Uncharacterized protein n=1 Tax=Fusarium anthophilum TaxID=48485 RepID=A0A8H4ZBS3_9HYPO|nr:hypothetical protein FANTH_8061 [Fusarium anthophilum]